MKNPGITRDFIQENYHKISVSSCMALDYARDAPFNGYLMKMKKGMYALTGRPGAKDQDHKTITLLSRHLNSLEKQISDSSDRPVESQINDWYQRPQEAGLLLQISDSLSSDTPSILRFLDYRQLIGMEEGESLMLSLVSLQEDNEGQLVSDETKVETLKNLMFSAMCPNFRHLLIRQELSSEKTEMQEKAEEEAKD